MAVRLGDIEPAAAHSVAQVELGLGMTPATQEMLIDRGTGIQSGDILDYVLEFTPVDNGSLDGPGGYVTLYRPAGTQVVGASIVQPSGTDYVDVPVSPPGGIPGDAGDTHAPYDAPFDDGDPYGRWRMGRGHASSVLRRHRDLLFDECDDSEVRGDHVRR